LELAFKLVINRSGIPAEFVQYWGATPVNVAIDENAGDGTKAISGSIPNLWLFSPAIYPPNE
jgi:hypothetical protein